MRGGNTENKNIISNNISLNKNSQENITYKNKHEEFFFDNYNSSYNTESNQVINSILRSKILNYYIID